MIKNGLITKGIGGLYTVQTDEGLYACTARGIFRNKKITPLPGDKVEIFVEEPLTATITAVKERKNALVRPAVVNIDQVMIIMSVRFPDFNPGLLDRFLVLAAHAGIDTVICINKCDLSDVENDPRFAVYKSAGYEVVFTSNKNYPHELKELMLKKLTVFAGPSGVGKSSLINALLPHAGQTVGEISTKLKRGKHTTRAAEILPLGEKSGDGYVADTPGFSSLETKTIPPKDMALYFREFIPFLKKCRFSDCLHAEYDKKEDCAVKAQVGQGISLTRYESYLSLVKR